MTPSNPMDKLQALDKVENDIVTCIQSAAQAIGELGKDKGNAKSADTNTSTFLKTLNRVECEIRDQINYLTQVSTGHAHEGSSYASQKVLQMAWHRSEHARSRVLDLDRMKADLQTLGTSQRQALGPAYQSHSSTTLPASHPSTPTGGQGTANPQTPMASVPVQQVPPGDS